MTSPSPRGPRWAVAALLAAAALLAVASMRFKSPTYDEAGHFHYGRQLLVEGDASHRGGTFGVAKMPPSALNALPWEVAERLGATRPLTVLATRRHEATPPSTHAESDIVYPLLAGRLATVAVSLLLGLLIYLWSRRLYGAGGGLLSLALWALCPNFLGHGRLVTNDVYAALGIVGACFLFARYLDRGGWGRATAAAVGLGAAQVAKHSALLLVPAFAAIGLALALAARRSPGRPDGASTAGPSPAPGPRLARAAAVLVLFAVVGLATINLAYLGEGALDRWSEHQLASAPGRLVQGVMVKLGDPPVLLPRPWLDGLDAVTHYEASGKGFGNIYLLGELRRTGPDLEGFAGYFLVAALFKVPLPTLVLILAGLGLHATRRVRSALGRGGLALFVPAAAYVVYFNFFYDAQIGFRHFLPALALLLVAAGAAASDLGRFRSTRRLALGALLAWLAVSVLSWFPHYLSYFNELAPDRGRTWTLLADSNVDWGQDEWYLEEDLARHPGTRVSPRRQVTGRVVVGINERVGVIYPGRYAWLDRYEPTGMVGASYLVYEIPTDR